MRIADLFRTAFSNLRRRKLRSFLTVFAVVIGASLVSLLVSLGVGTQDFLTRQIKATMPPDVVMVASSETAFQFGLGGVGFGGSPQEIGDDEGGSFALEPLTVEEIAAVGDIERVERTDPYVIFTGESVRLDGSDRRFRASVSPQPSYLAETRTLVAGRYIADGTQGECIIADQYIDSFGLTSAQDAIGREIVVRVGQASSLIGLPGQSRDFKFEIVGVAEKTINSTQIIVSIEDGKQMSRFWANNPDLYTDKIPPSMIQVKVAGSQFINQVAEEVEAMGLGAMTSEDVLGVIGTIFGIVQTVLSAFGLIALGVASLGIVNTLFMAIHERTREIGVMKAVGASKGTIRTLFTTEGATIGFVGGVVGVAIGYALGYILNRVSHATFLQDFPTFDLSVLPWWLAVGVIALTTIIALLAALYPAHRASSLDPIEALRYE